MSIITSGRKMTAREQTAYELGKHEAVMHGAWEIIERDMDKKTLVVMCSECGAHFYLTMLDFGLCYNYCPNCGAKMDLEKEPRRNTKFLSKAGALSKPTMKMKLLELVWKTFGAEYAEWKNLKAEE